jgi:TolB-like protein
MSKKLYRKVAVMPFKAQNELIGNSISDMFTTELLGAGLFELVERNQISKILEEQALNLKGVTTSQQAIKVGKILGVQGVIIGTVPEYGYKAVGSKKEPSVGLNIRIIDVEDGTILWSISNSGISQRLTNLPSFTNYLIKQIVRKLFKELTESALLFANLHLKNGTEYHGTILRGKPHVKGRMEWPDGNIYTGDFVKGERTGKGEMSFKKTGSRYTGGFERGAFHGHGTVIFGKNCILADGTYAATGERFKGSKFHYCESPGDRYEGKWDYGTPTGG